MILPSQKSQNGECPQDRTYKLSTIAFFEEYCRNETLRKVLIKGNYRYVNGYIVKAKSEYITVKDGQLFLTEYANSNLKKSALGFFTQSNNNSMLCFVTPFTKADFEEDYARIRRRNKTLGQLLKEIQEDYKISISKIVEKTGLSEAIIDRLRNDRKSESRELRTMVKLCAGLDLEPSVAHELLRLAGVSLNDTTRTNRAYEIIINNMQGYSAEVKENFLKDLDIEPLDIQDVA